MTGLQQPTLCTPPRLLLEDPVPEGGEPGVDAGRTVAAVPGAKRHNAQEVPGVSDQAIHLF